jgi:hypothetical protein
MTHLTQTKDVKAVLARLRITEFTNKKNDPSLNRRVANLVNADSDALETRKTLLVCPAITELSKIKGDARNNMFNPLTIAYEVGERILPANLIDKVEHDYAIRKQAHADAKTALRGQIDAAKERAKRKLGEAFDERDYPTADEIVGKFTMSLTYRHIPESKGLYILGLSDERNKEVRTDMDQQITDRLEDAVETIRERVVDVVGHLAEVASKYGYDKDGKVQGRFKDTTVTKVTDLGKILDDLNITDCPRIAKASAELKAKLSTITPDGIKNSAGERQRVAAEAKAIVNNLEGLYA